MNHDDPCKVAADALDRIYGHPYGMGAAEVIDVVRPLIEADLRERLAAAIEARITHDPDTCTAECDSPYCFGCGDCAETEAYRHAARIVRERP